MDLKPLPKVTDGSNYRFEVFEVMRETDKAFLLDFGDLELWVPKSICALGEDPDGLGAIVVDVPEWYAKRHKLIKT